MRKSRATAVCAAVTAAALVAALPASAEVKQAVFKATLSGSQVSTYEFHHKATGGCDISADAFGDQTIKFGDNKKTFKVTFTAPPKNQPDLFSTNGRPAVVIEPLLKRLKATADRNSDVKLGEADTSQCEGDNGGADSGFKPPQPDCGMRSGSFLPRLYFHDGSEDPDNLIVPIPLFSEKNNLKLDGSDWQWSFPGSPAHSSELRDTYETCPWLFDEDTLDQLGQIYISPAKVSEQKLFNKSRKHIVVSGHHIANRHDAESSGKTIIAWNLRLTRVK